MSASSLGGDVKVVVIDDEPDELLLAQHLIAAHFQHKLEVITCDQMNYQDLDWPTIGIAIIDLMMPVHPGMEILAWLAEHHPHVRRIAWTAAPSVFPQANKLAQVIPKPDLDTFLEAISLFAGEKKEKKKK